MNILCRIGIHKFEATKAQVGQHKGQGLGVIRVFTLYACARCDHASLRYSGKGDELYESYVKTLRPARTSPVLMFHERGGNC